MGRSLSLVFVAVLLAAAMLVVPKDGWPHQLGGTVQAHAWGACGVGTDQDDTAYGPRGYQSRAWQVWDASQGQYVTAYTDLSYYNLTHAGRCYTAYRSSAWGPWTNTNGYYGYLRVWVCGHQEYDEARYATGTGVQVIDHNWDGYRDARTWYVGGVVQDNMTFYDNSGCGYQADQLWTAADSQYWSARPASAVGGAWYLKY